jgi:transposase
MNTKLHAVTDADGHPIRFFMTAGEVTDYTGAAVLLHSLPKAEWLLADRGYDADWFRDRPDQEKLALKRRASRARISSLLSARESSALGP